MRTTAKLALVCLTVLLVASTTWANVLEVKVDVVYDALGNPITDPNAISPDGKTAFIPDGGAITFGLYIDLGTDHPTGLGGFAASLLTGDGTANGPGRERFGVTHLPGTTTFDLAGSSPFASVSDSSGVLTASQATDAIGNPLYPLNGISLPNYSGSITFPNPIKPPDLGDLNLFGGTVPAMESNAVVPNDTGLDWVALGASQDKTKTNKASGGANVAWVPGIATMGGTVGLPAPNPNGAYGNGAWKGPLEVAQATYTAVPRGTEAGARSVQVNAFFFNGFQAGGAQISSLANTTTAAATNSVNGDVLVDPSGIGGPVMVIVGTGQGGQVPEPSTIILLITGAVGLFLARRRWC